MRNTQKNWDILIKKRESAMVFKKRDFPPESRNVDTNARKQVKSNWQKYIMVQINLGEKLELNFFRYSIWNYIIIIIIMAEMAVV